MNMIHKYVRTQHVHGSRLQHGDEDLDLVRWKDLSGRHLVVEEKVDGANVGISFAEDGELLLQCRGHYLRGGPREKQFNVFKQWAACHREALHQVLSSRFVLYAEWLAAKHTVFYDALPHYLMEFDILDTQDGKFLSTSARKELLYGGKAVAPVTQVRVLHEGQVASLGNLTNMVSASAFFTQNRVHNFLNAASEAGVLPRDGAFGNKEIQEALATEDWDPNMEGLYIKVEEAGEVKLRCKLVRQSFTNSIIDQETHWHDRPIINNQLLPGALERMFAQ